MWHRVTLFLTWASVVCHRELYHCGQVRVTTSAALPQQRLSLTLSKYNTAPLESTDCFCFSWVHQKWFSVIALHHMHNGWTTGRLLRGGAQAHIPTLYTYAPPHHAYTDTWGWCVRSRPLFTANREEGTDGRTDGGTDRWENRGDAMICSLLDGLRPFRDLWWFLASQQHHNLQLRHRHNDLCKSRAS